MENLPTTIPEKTTDSKDSKKSKKKLGRFVVSPVSEQPKAENSEKQSWFSRESKPKKSTEELPATEQNETAAPLEELSPEERDFAVRSIIEDAQQYDPEIAGDDVAAQAAAEAIAQFRNEVIENGQDIDSAEAAVLEEIGIENTSEAEPQAAAETNDDAPQELQEGIINLSNSEDTPEATAPPIVPPNMPPVGGQGGNGGGSVPPQNPNSGPTPFPPIPPRRGGGASVIAAAAATPFMTPNRVMANTVPAPEQFVDQANPMATAMIGGIIGYFIGRRRGRIKTEKRLLPVQKKLQKEVTDLQWQVKSKEANIAKLAAQQARAGKLPVRKIKPSPRMHFEAAAVSVIAEASPRAALKQPQNKAERMPASAPELIKITTKPEAPTHIGHMIVTAESRPALQKKQERLVSLQAEKSSERMNKLPEKRVETLNRTELLKLSERVVVDGASLRQIYETKLVGEKGLRRLLQIHLRGGDIKKALRREIVEREIDFERDPVLRDKPSALAAAVGGGTAISLQQLLKQADAAVGNNTEEKAFFKARADYESRENVRGQQKQRVMDISLVTIIATLFSVILVLMVR